MKQSTRDNLIYLTVGLSIAALLAADAFYAVSHNREMWMPSRFVLRLGYTTLLLGYFVARETFKLKATIGQVIGCVLIGSVMHLAMALGFREAINRLPGLSFSALVVLEIFLLVQLAEHVVMFLKSSKN